MKAKNILIKISYIALLSALTFICTYFIQIPYGGGSGYFNLSDSIIIFSSIYFGPVVGVFSGIIGATIADIASGYASVAIFTIIAKGLEGIFAFLIYKWLFKAKYLRYLSFLIAPLFMVLSYFPYYLVFYEYNFASSILNSSFDLIQGYINAALAFSLLFIFNRIELKEKYNYLKEKRKKNLKKIDQTK